MSALFGIVFLAVSSAVEDQIKIAIEAKTKLMVHEAEVDSLEDLANMISKMEQVARASRFLLVDSKGQRLAGSLSGIENSAGWTRIDLKGEDSDGNSHKKEAMLVLGTFVPEKQALLFVGQSTAELDDLKSFIARSFIWSATTTCGLAIAFGLVTASAFLRRVEAVNTAAASIMAGDLAHRVPVRGTNDEFDRLSQNLNHMLDRIDHLFEQLRQVSNDIAHDLRTPLSRLRQGLETARAKAQSVETYASAIDDAIEQTNEIISIFGSLLRIAQIEAGVNTQELRSTDLSEIFGRVYGAYESVAQDQGKYLVQRVESGVVILGDRHLLTQMISNFVENALCHTLPGTTITVQLTCDNRSVVGLITDNGPGIPEESRDKVFQRFFRLDRSRSTPGSGLGLSLVAAIAAMHHITITLSDNKPGLRVVLSFPQAQHQIDPSIRTSPELNAVDQAAAPAF